MLISDEYKKLNKELHERNPTYGRSGSKNLHLILELSLKHNTKDMLDYGCGKSTLNENLPFQIQQYDPAIEKYSILPFPADIVICTDVMEHIEPDCLDSVLEHIKGLTRKCAFFVISTIPARKHLEDGRNAHISLHDVIWWENKLEEYFRLDLVKDIGDDVIIVCEPKEVFNGIKI